MLDTQLQTVMFLVGALVVGVVIFGGTTLAYFMGSRPSQAAPVLDDDDGPELEEDPGDHDGHLDRTLVKAESGATATPGVRVASS